MIHRIIDLSFDLLARFWPVALGVCALAFIIVVMITLRIARGKSAPKSAKSKQKPKPFSARQSNSVMSSLERLPKDHYESLHEVFVPRLDGQGTTRIHHVVLSRYGIYVLHVQNECGDISGDPDGREWTSRQKDGMRVFTNPVHRNAYHVKALVQHLKLPEALFHSLIIFDSEVRFETPPPPNVLTHGLGSTIISQTAEIISPELLQRVSAQLCEATGNKDLDSRRREHTKDRMSRLKHTHEKVV